jgi:hypothetical protein
MDTDKTEAEEAFKPSEQTLRGEDSVRDLTADDVSFISEEPCSSTAGAGLAGGEPEAVTNRGSSARQKGNCQNKPTAERSTVVQNGPGAPGLIGNEATSEHRPDQESDDSGSARRPAASADEMARSDSYKEEEDLQGRFIHSHIAAAGIVPNSGDRDCVGWISEAQPT